MDVVCGSGVRHGLHGRSRGCNTGSVVYCMHLYIQGFQHAPLTIVNAKQTTCLRAVFDVYCCVRLRFFNISIYLSKYIDIVLARGGCAYLCLLA